MWHLHFQVDLMWNSLLRRRHPERRWCHKGISPVGCGASWEICCAFQCVWSSAGGRTECMPNTCEAPSSIPSPQVGGGPEHLLQCTVSLTVGDSQLRLLLHLSDFRHSRWALRAVVNDPCHVEILSRRCQTVRLGGSGSNVMLHSVTA